ncbi:MAG: META domain-containing protein [Mycobacterium sp.]|jgi:heat shock protein HslJ
MRGLRSGAALAAAVVVITAGCGPAAASDPIAGTSWQLLSIESMTTEQPTTTIDDPAKYTVAFGDNGLATFQIDCNRGSGTFQTTAGGPDSGNLIFGPVGLTRMFCPQPSVDTTVAAALGRIRSYLLADGQLHLSMEADGGIMHWEPKA